MHRDGGDHLDGRDLSDVAGEVVEADGLVIVLVGLAAQGDSLRGGKGRAVTGRGTRGYTGSVQGVAEALTSAMDSALDRARNTCRALNAGMLRD
ncbi:hypothetical protein GCM10010430_15120 [Kitasatospora cystarginea]|uniref:Uncharacterized protein n=1 Tax=Kitasatospora cystarginea TaxID=58350 RepID=A0ABN3DL77_9ACTN